MRVLKNTVPTTMSQTFGLSPMPSHNRNTGVRALAGMYRRNPICASQNASIDVNDPMRTPLTVPSATEIP